MSKQNEMETAVLTSGDRAEAVLASIGVTRVEAAREIGVSRALFTMNLNGTSRMRHVTALALEARYGINARYLLHGEAPVFVQGAASGLSDGAVALALMYERLPAASRRAIRSLLRGLGK
jgi:hypothetical protein